MLATGRTRDNWLNDHDDTGGLGNAPEGAVSCTSDRLGAEGGPWCAAALVLACPDDAGNDGNKEYAVRAALTCCPVPGRPTCDADAERCTEEPTAARAERNSALGLMVCHW